MSDRTTDQPEEEIAGSRVEYLDSGGSNVARTLVALLFPIVFGIAALVIFVPGAIQDMLTSGSSDSEDMQETVTADPNIDTGFPDPAPVETEPVETADPFPEAKPDTGPSPAERRIAALEQQLRDLQNAQNNGGDLDAALEQQRQDLRDEFATEREALQQQIDELRNRPVELREASVIPGLGGGDGETNAERRARERLEEERARRAAIREEQINSESVVVDGASNVRGSGGNATSGGPGGSRNLSDREQFMADASSQAHETAQAGRIPQASRTIVQGTTVQAILETAVSSELPGVMRAVVVRDVYSYDGSNILLPKGTRLIGEYNSDVSVVQGRVQMAWSRAITPTGVSVELGGYGSDRLGRSGQSGFVDSRFRARFGSAALISLIDAGPQVVINEDAGENEQDIAEDVGGDLERASQGVMEDYLSAGPVIYVDQGTELTVFVNRDLVF
jgi:type IV secretion system protein VirB10